MCAFQEIVAYLSCTNIFSQSNVCIFLNGCNYQNSTNKLSFPGTKYPNKMSKKDNIFEFTYDQTVISTIIQYN